MSRKPQKNNASVIAIIGVLGTIIGTAITVMGNFNIEKLRQETELTRIALVSISTQTAESKFTEITDITSTPYQTPVVTISPVLTSTIPVSTKSYPSLNPAVTLEITWKPDLQVEVKWSNLPPEGNLYVMKVNASNRYYAPTPISEMSGNQDVTIDNNEIKYIAIVKLTGATRATFPDTGVEAGDSQIIIDVQIKKSIPPKK
jgi:hypothetical protein